MKLTTKLSLIIAGLSLPVTGIMTVLVYKLASQGSVSLLLALIISLAVTVISTIIIILIMNQQIMKPIRSLSAAVARVTLGDLSQDVSVHSHDELGSLSASFNEMIRQLGSTHRSLEASIQVAKEGRAQLESSINGLRQGFVMVDMTNKVLLANAGAMGIVFGEDDAAKHSKSSLELGELTRILPKDLDLRAKITQTLKSHRLAKFPNLPLGGRFLNLYMSPVVNGATAIGCVLLLEDVTEERIMERSRDEFFSIASHELRTPLTAIRGNAKMMLDYFPQLTKEPDVKEMIDDIHDSTIRLITIVNDFLDTSRLEQNKMQLSLTTFPVEQSIEKTIYEMAGLSREKHIALQFDQDTLGHLPVVYADPGRVTQVVYNLIGNAMKFTEKGGVTINCLIEAGFVKVCVSDTGQGISDEGKQLLFHKFQQSTTSILTRDNTRGTGLGLYISKLLVEHMGGAIKLEHTEAGKGSTFSFTLPIATPAQIKQAKTAPVVSPLSTDT